jgi:hypothetical protein
LYLFSTPSVPPPPPPPYLLRRGGFSNGDIWAPSLEARRFLRPRRAGVGRERSKGAGVGRERSKGAGDEREVGRGGKSSIPLKLAHQLSTARSSLFFPLNRRAAKSTGREQGWNERFY